jgi:predicted component of viral defense system (DUF524 family)
VKGTGSRAGLVSILQLLSQRPYEVLRAHERWTDRQRARRIDAARLVQSFSRPANLDADQLPILVPERPVEHSVDVYENRLLKTFYDQVDMRLRAVIRALERQNAETLTEAGQRLLHRLTAARRTAGFLDDVSEITEPPSRVTMVLLKRGEYRAALEGLLELRRRALVQLHEPAIGAPLANLPFLYQSWGVLEAVIVVLELAGDLGYQVRKESLSRRGPGELWIQLLRDGDPAIVLTHPKTQAVARLIPQRRYSANVAGVHSVSFAQIPDIALELTANGRTAIYIFDPKYKLQSEDLEGEDPHARPKKIDIDAMHSYRDAIRSQDGAHAVKYAAILYPGPDQAYGDGLAAIRARPSDPQGLEHSIRAALYPAFAWAATSADPEHA